MTPLEPWILEKTNSTLPTQEALRAYQLQELRNVLTYAKEKSRFYSKTLGAINLSDIQSLNDFQHIPFTTSADIQQNAYDFLCVSQAEIERIVTLNTSGTMGEAKRIFFTQEDLEMTIDFFHHGMLSLVDETDTVMVLLPGTSYGSIGDLLKKALALCNIKCVVHGLLNDVEMAKKCIEEEGVTCIVGIPMQVLYLSKLNPELFQQQIKKVLLSTDYVPDVLVEALRAKGCQVFNHYGMSEMGYGGGVECECLNGYHLRENHLYFEIIDPLTLQNVKEGEYGEVVFTTLRRQAMPLIRYRTGDIARFSTKACACGTFLRTMDKVLGRMDNKITLNSREIHLREFDEILLRFDTILDYTLRFDENEALHANLTLRSLEDFETLAQKLQAAFLSYFGNTFDVYFDAQTNSVTPLMTSSMIKRKIDNFRNKERRQ